MKPRSPDGAGFSRPRSLLEPLVCASAIFLGCLALHGQDTPAQAAGQTNTVAVDSLQTQIRARLAGASNMVDLAASTRSNLVATYTRALDRLQSAQAAIDTATKFEAEITNALSLLAKIRKELDQPAPAAEPALTNLPLADLAKALTKLESDVAEAAAAKGRLESEVQLRVTRASELTRLLGEARASLAAARTPAGAPPAEEPSETARQAARDLQLSLERLREAEVRQYQSELAYYTATAELVPAQLDLATRRLAQLTRQREAMVALVNQRRQEQAAELTAQAEEARRRAEVLKEPALTKLAAQNTLLASNRTVLAANLEASHNQLDQAATNLARIRSDFLRIRARVEAVEDLQLHRNYALGLLLRRERASLAKLSDRRLNLTLQVQDLSEAQLALFNLSEARAQLGDLDLRVDTFLEALPPETPSWKTNLVAREARQLLKEQRQLLEGSAQETESQISLLLQLRRTFQELVREREAFAAYLDARVLWIRSTDWLSPRAIRAETVRIRQAFASSDWVRALATIRKDCLDHLPIYLCAAVLMTGLIAGRPLVLRRLAVTAGIARRGSNTALGPTLEAVVGTLWLALPIAVPLAFIGWRMGSAAGGNDLFLDRVSQSLILAGQAYAIVAFLRQACRPEGLAVAHLQWPEKNAALIWRHLGWLLPIALPLGLVNLALEGDFTEGLSNRVVFIPGLLVFAVSPMCY